MISACKHADIDMLRRARWSCNATAMQIAPCTCRCNTLRLLWTLSKIAQAAPPAVALWVGEAATLCRVPVAAAVVVQDQGLAGIDLEAAPGRAAYATARSRLCSLAAMFQAAASAISSPVLVRCIELLVWK